MGAECGTSAFGTPELGCYVQSECTRAYLTHPLLEHLILEHLRAARGSGTGPSPCSGSYCACAPCLQVRTQGWASGEFSHGVLLHTPLRIALTASSLRAPAAVRGQRFKRARAPGTSLERYYHLLVIPITSFTMERTIDERTGYRSSRSPIKS